MKVEVTPYLTKQEWIYNELKRQIEDCTLMPGERLLLDQIAETFHASRVPAREALLQLQAEGLVEIIPHCGAVVAPIDFSSASDYFAVSRSLQVLASRMACQRATEDELRELERIVEEMEKCAESGDKEEYSVLNHHFHDTIAEISRMPLVPEFLKTFQNQWHRFECYYDLYPMPEERIEETLAQHREILDALLSRDEDRVEKATIKHNLTGLEDHLRHMNSRKEKIN